MLWSSRSPPRELCSLRSQAHGPFFASPDLCLRGHIPASHPYPPWFHPPQTITQHHLPSKIPSVMVATEATPVHGVTSVVLGLDPDVWRDTPTSPSSCHFPC